MKRLYWTSPNIKALILASRATNFNPMGGLGLSLAPYKIVGHTKENVKDLGVDRMFFQTSLLHNYDDERLVVIRRLGKNFKNFTNQETIITSGYSFISKLMDTNSPFTPSLLPHEIIKDYPFIEFTEDGDETLQIDCRPLTVVPIYDGKLDKDFMQWEMFEEMGYIYGKDNRTGEIYELEQHIITLTQAFTPHTEAYELYVIRNERDTEKGIKLLNDITEEAYIDPLHSKDYADWVLFYNQQRLDCRISAISNHRQLSQHSGVVGYMERKK